MLAEEIDEFIHDWEHVIRNRGVYACLDGLTVVSWGCREAFIFDGRALYTPDEEMESFKFKKMDKTFLFAIRPGGSHVGQ